MDKNFWEDIDNVLQNEKERVYNQIEAEWGKSTVTLKNWLQLYYPFIVNDKQYSKLNRINADQFLPPRKGRLWTGTDAINRLKLAVKAEAVIIFSGKEPNKSIMHIYKVRCLKLWTRINSLVTKFSFDEFKNLLDQTLIDVLQNWDETVNFLLEKSKAFKREYDKILYHYVREDFEPIRYEENRVIAYNKWIVEVWPTLLDKYKAKKLEEYKASIIQQNEINNKSMSADEYSYLINQYKARLNKIKITKIGYTQFTKILKKLKKNYYEICIQNSRISEQAFVSRKFKQKLL